MKIKLSSVINDINIANTENSEYIKSGYKKLSKGLLFYKYLFPFIYIFLNVYIVINTVFIQKLHNSVEKLQTFSIFFISIFVLLDVIYAFTYLKIYRKLKTIYYNSQNIVIIDGLDKKINVLNYNQLIGTDYYCVNKGIVKYGAIMYKIDNTSLKVYFSVNRKTEKELIEIDNYIRLNK